MAPKNKTSPPLSFPIGNCEVTVEAKKFTPETTTDSLQITFSKNVKIKISVAEGEQRMSKTDKSEGNGDYYFVLVNPKESDDKTKSLVQEILELYSKELPAMNFAANTGKESTFLQRCVSNGRYCTLVLKHRDSQHQEEVVSAISYQIVPPDTQYAEIPLASVSFKFQGKGIGRLMYMELRERLQRVGVRSIFCWGDQESEGFWLKQGFKVIGEVNRKGRARRLPVKADVRKALCFPGGSTLMLSHLNDNSPLYAQQVKLFSLLKPSEKHHSSNTVLKLQPGSVEESTDHADGNEQIVSSTGHSEGEDLAAETIHINGCQDVDFLKPLDCCSKDNKLEFGGNREDGGKNCSCSTEGTKKRMWESLYTSLNSKKVKGCHTLACQSNIRDSLSGDTERNCSSNSSSLRCGYQSLMDGATLTIGYLEENHKECTSISEDRGSCKPLSNDTCFRIMLMNIADENKKASLTKIIEDLGGVVTSDGSASTHVVTGKVRRTLNFCTALCSGAWIISPSWLKESYRNGRFVDEMPFILKDEEYESKYRTELKIAIQRAKANPFCLLKGHNLCLAAHVQPPMATLTAIIKSAGGNVIRGLDEAKEASSVIFIACGEDMEEALVAVKRGIRTFSSEWLMNCILKQELNLEASQFAESL